jgi:DNA-binding transcriptional MerR regulator
VTSAERDAGPVPGGTPGGSALSIGAVLEALRPDFPDVTISKIRFLESEDLIHPRRTASGYRRFSAEDVSRLRFVLAAQRDRYLPLKVIKEQLDAIDSGGSPGGGPVVRRLDTAPHRGGAPADGLPNAADFVVGPGQFAGSAGGGQFAGSAGGGTRMTREQLLADGDITAATLVELEQHGLVRPGPAGFYDNEAVQIARTARQLIEFGLQPRHLRAFRAAADREVGLLSQLAAPLSRQRDPDARQRADEVVRELAALCVRLHALLVKAGLRASG